MSHFFEELHKNPSDKLKQQEHWAPDLISVCEKYFEIPKCEFKKTPKQIRRNKNTHKAKAQLEILDSISNSDLRHSINEICQCFETDLNSSEVSDVKLNEEKCEFTVIQIP
ncbi:11511_t:CDS:2 [Ambispora gerdemannii]|uniref:11511_t:CDS:1 n=1 Tax=Ambispora gerdemannii TaxID=144530 RepID=A0A9N9G207_9GLOM|nr:11511_t:CDS:2 [Ambispora gerdemannii]